MYVTSILSASTMIGNPVVNDGGENLGKIEELMIDTSQGNIAFAVLSFGGFLGIGDKYFAVPWEILKVDKMNHQFILNKTKEELENAPGFDKDNWPKTGDTEFLDSVYTYHGSKRYWDAI